MVDCESDSVLDSVMPITNKGEVSRIDAPAVSVTGRDSTECVPRRYLTLALGAVGTPEHMCWGAIGRRPGMGDGCLVRAQGTSEQQGRADIGTGSTTSNRFPVRFRWKKMS